MWFQNYLNYSCIGLKWQILRHFLQESYLDYIGAHIFILIVSFFSWLSFHCHECLLLNVQHCYPFFPMVQHPISFYFLSV